MDKKQKEEQLDLFSEAFHEVVVPVLEDMQKDITTLKDDVGRIENKLDKEVVYSFSWMPSSHSVELLTPGVE